MVFFSQENSSVDNLRLHRPSLIIVNDLLADLVNGIQNAALCRKNAVRSKEHTDFRTLCVGGPLTGSAESLVYATGKSVIIRYLKRLYCCLSITQ